MHHPSRIITSAAAAALLILGCSEAAEAPASEATEAQAGGTPDATEDPEDEQRFPDVLEAELESADGGYRLSATISSPYDTPDRYADAFRARTPDGQELGVRELLHDHANEQPFTRSLDGLQIPDDVEEIVVEARDQQYGWGGATVTVTVPDR